MRVEYTFDVVGYGECRIRTPGIDEPFPASDEDLIHVVAFFFTTAIRFREFEAIRAAAHFRDHVWGRPVRLYGDQRDTQVLDDLEREMDRIIRGRLLVVEQVAPVVAPKQTMPRTTASSSRTAPVAPPPVTEELPVHFELSFVDELGDPISGLSSKIHLRHDGVQWTLSPDGGGTIRLDRPYGASTAWARLADQDAVDALRDAVKPLWDQAKRVQDRKDRIITEEGEETSIVYFRSAPPSKEGQPAQQTPLLTRDFRLVTDEPHRVSVQPYVELARLIGFYFDTNKCFLLPTAMPSLQAVVDIYERNRNSCLLIVGHTDTSGQDAYNETLSLERAESMAAYLHDRVDDWVAWYGWDKPDEKRWGAHEDSLMMESLSGRGLELDANSVRSYQQWHNALSGGERAPNWEVLDEDGKIGLKTRAQLVGDYMNHDRTTLDPGVAITTHGCGECFPLDETGEQLDPDPANPERDQRERRVEVFFFDRSLGVHPPPAASVSGRGSSQYVEWLLRVFRSSDYFGEAETLHPHPAVYIRDSPDHTNLVFVLSLPLDGSTIENAVLTVGETALDPEEDFYIHGSRLFFRTRATGSQWLRGQLTIACPNRRVFVFRLRRANTLAEDVDSLAEQMLNAVELAHAAAARAHGDGKSDATCAELRAELLNDGFHCHLQIVGAIERRLVTNEEHRWFYERLQSLPTMYNHGVM